MKMSATTFFVLVLALAGTPLSSHAQDMDWKSLLNEATSLLEMRRYDRAADLAQEALTVSERPAGSDHADAAFFLERLASTYERYEQLAPAEALLKRALAIRENTLGSEDGHTLGTMDSLAMFYHQHAQDEEAEPLFKRALAIRDKGAGRLGSSYKLELLTT
jgi:tetratricopeptide (TPR) repeat protein